MFAPLYRYACQVNRVIDGDTLDVTIDQGLHCFRRERVRLLNVNCPEKNTPQGRTAAVFVLNWLSVGNNSGQGERFEFKQWPFVVQTYKADSFGRWLGVLCRRFDGAILNQDLIDNGHAQAVGP